MKKGFCCFFFLMFMFQFAGFQNKLAAQNWTGNINSDWNNSANWSSWPLNNVNIVINPVNYTGASASPVLSSASVFSPRKVLMQNGAQLLIQNNLTTTDNVDVFDAGTLLTISAGTINIGVSTNSRLMADAGGGIIINNGSLTIGKSLAVGSGSTITMHNGNVNALQRLLADLGGLFIFNNGSITVGQRLSVSDGDLVRSSTFQMNGGNMIVNTEFTFINEFGNHTPVFNQSAGTLTVNGNVIWLGIAPGTGSPQWNMTGGTVNINGNIQNSAGSTISMYIKIGDACNFQFNGSLIDQLYASDSIIQNNNTQFFLNTTGTWTNNGAFTAVNSRVTFNGNTSIQGTGVFGFDDVSIANGKTLNHISPPDINIRGDFLNNGIFSANLNRVTFNGADPQLIDGSSITSFYQLKITNTSIPGVNVKKSILVTGY